ncbi:MAG: hypothetical protein IKE61_03315, partial [Coriobacteriales bacterium]|nr:hypothetical protein [Coriobacteriales bacterium]
MAGHEAGGLRRRSAASSHPSEGSISLQRASSAFHETLNYHEDGTIMLFVLTGDVKTGKTRWLQELVEAL